MPLFELLRHFLLAQHLNQSRGYTQYQRGIKLKIEAGLEEISLRSPLTRL